MAGEEEVGTEKIGIGGQISNRNVEVATLFQISVEDSV